MDYFINEDIALLIIRAIVGVAMLYYGWFKIKDLKSNYQFFANIGFRPAWFFSTMAVLNEFIGGLMILLGFYIWVPAITFGIQMLLGTIWKATKTEKPFTDWSYDLLLLALMLIFLIYGGGAFALTP